MGRHFSPVQPCLLSGMSTAEHAGETAARCRARIAAFHWQLLKSPAVSEDNVYVYVHLLTEEHVDVPDDPNLTSRLHWPGAGLLSTRYGEYL